MGSAACSKVDVSLFIEGEDQVVLDGRSPEGDRRIRRADTLPTTSGASQSQPGSPIGGRAESAGMRRSLTGIHSFQKVSIRFSDMCEVCGDMIYPFSGPAYRCTGCGFLSHKSCQDNLRTECRPRLGLMGKSSLGSSSSYEAPQVSTGAHIFYKKNFSKPEYCNVCRKLLKGVRKQGYSCQVCRYSVHESCEGEATNTCKKGFYTFQEATNHKKTIHQWAEGNIKSRHEEVNCVVCSSPVGSSSGLTGFRCVWCHCCIHTDCFDADGIPCDLGIFQRFIMPPHRVILFEKDESPELRFINDDQHTPIVVFINRKSGGQAGTKIQKKLGRLLNPLQIFNLADGGPEPGLRKFIDIKSKIILVCGGDGTVGWVLQVMDRVLPPHDKPPVLILPLGTGNDLARVLGWGGGYDGEDISRILKKAITATESLLDRWKVEIIHITPASPSSPKPGNKELIMNNYFSIGVDAKIALNFHEERERHPEKFKSRTRNKIWYGEFGAKAAFNGCPNLHRQVTLECDGKLIAIDEDIEGIIVMNIPSYAGGTDLWGGSRGSGFKPQSFADGLLEAIGVSGSIQMGAIRAHLASATRLCQGSNIKITIQPGEEYPVQVDGEPWNQSSSVIDITFLNQSNMLVAQ